MYRFERSARIKLGKERDALQFALKVAHYLERNYSVPVEVFTEVFGNLGTVYWHATYEDLASAEKVIDALAADREYRAMIVDAADSIIDGSVTDKLLKSQSRQ